MFVERSKVLRIVKIFFMWIVMLPKMVKQPSICGSGKVHFIGDGFLTTRPVGTFDNRLTLAYQKGVFEETPDYIHNYSYTIWRFQVYNWAITNALALEGDLVEIGVWWGVLSYASIEYNENDLKGKTFHLVDAYGAGGGDDLKQHGSIMPYSYGKSVKDYSEDIFSQVKNRFRGKPVKFHRGYVPQILEDSDLPDKVAFLSLDLNNVSAEQSSIEYLWDKVVMGGFVYIDDYGGQGHEDTRHMYDAFFSKRNCDILITPHSSALVMKR